MLQLEQDRALPQLTDRWTSLTTLQTAMISTGLNIFVNEHSKKYASVCAKVRITVLYRQSKIHIHLLSYLLRFSLFFPAGPAHGARRLRTDGSPCLGVCLLMEQVECKLRLGTSGCAGRPSPTNPNSWLCSDSSPGLFREFTPNASAATEWSEKRNLFVADILIIRKGKKKKKKTTPNIPPAHRHASTRAPAPYLNTHGACSSSALRGPRSWKSLNRARPSL